MIKHLILILITILLIEVIKIFKIKNLIKSILKNINKIPILLKKSSNSQKLEKIYFQVSKQVLIESFKILLFLICILGIFMLIFYINNDFFKFIISIESTVEILLIALAYLKIKNFYARKL